MAQMQALELHAPGDIRVEQVGVPDPGPDDVLVRVAWCGVCGSDIPRIFVTGAHRHPLIPGHEMSGVVASVGGPSSGFRAGEAVVVLPLIWCGQCASCELGQYAQCAAYDYLGSRRDGGFAEYVACPARNVRRAPVGLPLDHAAMTEPAAVALHALRRVRGGVEGAAVVVFGAGPIGNLVAQWARLMGAGKVALFDIAEDRLRLARRLGFRYAFHSAERSPSEVVRELTHGIGADVCVEAAGVPATVLEACVSVRTGGAVVLLGNPSADVTLPVGVVSRLLRTEASVLGVWNSTFRTHSRPDDWDMALEAMADGRLAVAPLVSHHVAIGDGVWVLHSMFERRGSFEKVLIGPD